VEKSNSPFTAWIRPFTLPEFFFDKKLLSDDAVVARFREQALAIFNPVLQELADDAHHVTGVVVMGCMGRDPRLTRLQRERQIIVEVLQCQVDKVVLISASGEVGFMEPIPGTCKAAGSWTADDVRSYNTRVGVDPGIMSGFYMVEKGSSDERLDEVLDQHTGKQPQRVTSPGTASQTRRGTRGGGQTRNMVRLRRGELSSIAHGVDIMLISNGRAFITMLIGGVLYL
jgi:hypothetical protein